MKMKMKTALHLSVLLLSIALLEAQEESCVSPLGQSGTCINIRRCERLLQLLRNVQSDPSAYTTLRESLCGYEGYDPVVCCPREEDRVVPPSTAPSTYSLPTLDDNCGINNATLSRKVVNGVPSELGAWPWIAVLGYRSKRTPGKTLWQCGATLITTKHVITAAHCIHGHEDDIYLVRLGELNLERTDDGASPVDMSIDKLTIHEEYSPVKHVNDIAMITMSSDVTLNTLIWPICIPKTPELRANNFEKTMPFIAGWGSTSFKGQSAAHLQETQLPVVANSYCAERYARFKNQVIDQRVLCAGYLAGGKDACQGDSGGPLMWPTFPPNKNNIHYYLIGIVSYGFKCAEPDYPGVYTRVTEFVDWIEGKLNI